MSRTDLGHTFQHFRIPSEHVRQRQQMYGSDVVIHRSLAKGPGPQTVECVDSLNQAKSGGGDVVVRGSVGRDCGD